MKKEFRAGPGSTYPRDLFTTIRPLGGWQWRTGQGWNGKGSRIDVGFLRVTNTSISFAVAR
jgi:hypothetical protein